MKSGAAPSAEYELHSGRGWPTSETALERRVNTNDANGYYKALGLDPDASMDEIRAAYRRLIKKCHPDLGGDEELFLFIVEIANVLLNPRKKSDYDSVEDGFIFIGDMEREELARSGIVFEDDEPEISEVVKREHWACLTDKGYAPGDDSDAWIYYCQQVSPAVGYRDKIRVGIVEGATPWEILTVGAFTFMVFQRGIEPNRLHALCAMIELQKQIRHG